MIRPLQISIFFLFIISRAYSQSFEHRKFKYDWHDEIKVTLTQSEKYKDYDAVILHEETTIDVALKNIKRYQIFQFNTQESIDEFNLFRIPIAMDPHMAAIESIYRNDTADFPKLLYEKINFFDARIIRNGEIQKAVLDELAYRFEERTGEYLIPYYIHFFYVRNLLPGDQLEVVISHQWPLSTFSYYLNEKLPKQEAFITINNEYLGKVNVYQNSELATLGAFEQSVGNMTYKMEFDNIEPLDPHFQSNLQNLPRIEMYMDKTVEVSEQLFGKNVIDTLGWREVLMAFVKLYVPGEARTWENYDLQSYKTTEFFTKIKQLSGDSLKGAELMNFIQEYTADKLDYKNDYNFYIHNEHGFVDMGSYLEKGILRESARFDYYFNMLDRIDKPYYKAYLQDRRINTIDTTRLTPFSLDHPSYWMYDENFEAHVYLPKRTRAGFYTNELPFYFSEEYTFLIPQTVPSKVYEREDHLIKFPVRYIAPYPYIANQKKTQISVGISLDTLKYNVESEVYLSGQFSTLTRGYFLYGSKDTTISPTYYGDIFQQFPDKKIKVKTAKKTFPYTHMFEIEGNSYQNVYSTVDGTYIIDLRNLINIHFEKLEEKYFKGNFRHDFMGKEEFLVELYFDELVTLQDMDRYNQEITTEGFTFTSNLSKKADNEYILKVVWDVTEEYTEPKDLKQLETAFRAIKKFVNLKLAVKRQ